MKFILALMLTIPAMAFAFESDSDAFFMGSSLTEFSKHEERKDESAFFSGSTPHFSYGTRVPASAPKKDFEFAEDGFMNGSSVKE